MAVVYAYLRCVASLSIDSRDQAVNIAKPMVGNAGDRAAVAQLKTVCESVAITTSAKT